MDYRPKYKGRKIKSINDNKEERLWFRKNFNRTHQALTIKGKNNKLRTNLELLIKIFLKLKIPLRE